MPFNRLQYQTRIQLALNDIFGVFHDNTIVQDSIQDGYDEILCDTQCAESLFTFTTSPTELYLDLYNVPVSPDFMRSIRIFNQGTNRWVPIKDTRFLDQCRYDWEVAYGSSEYAYVVNHQHLAFFPHKAATYDIYYKVCPDILNSDSQVLRIPTQFTRSLENYCVADLLEASGEISKASQYWKDYRKVVEDLKLFVAQRMAPELSYVLGEI